MRIYIDESGSFQIPNTSDEHAAAVVMGIVVPEVSEDRLFEKYAEFTETLNATERKNGEPKGAKMSREHRSSFAQMLASVPGVLVIPTTADLSGLADIADKFPARLSADLARFATTCKYQTMRNEVTTLSRQVANLSTTEILKLLLYTVCIQESVHHAVAYLSEPPYRECWSLVDIAIDRLSAKATSREKQVFRTMVLSWLTAWSEHRPLMTITEIHTDDHPFIQNFEMDTGGIDLRKLCGDGLRWADSVEEPGVQIADIAAAIVFDAVHDLKNHYDRLPNFLEIIKCCPYAATDGPGLVTLWPEGTYEPRDKWVGIVRAIADNYPKKAGRFRGLRQPPESALPRPGSKPKKSNRKDDWNL